MTPQDYVNLTIEKLDSSRCASARQIVDYCIANADCLDPGDIEKIEKIVNSTLETLCDSGSLSFCEGKYRVEGNICKVEGFVFDEVPRMKKHPKSAIDAINAMDRTVTYDSYLVGPIGHDDECDN